MAKAKKKSTGDQQSRKEKVDQIIFDVAEKMIKLIETTGQGQEWERPWHANGFSAPKNPVSGHYFSGFNRYKLMFEMLDRGSSDPRFLTFKQLGEFNDANQTECKIIPGEKAIYVLRPSIKKIKAEDDTENDEGVKKDKTILFFNPYPVFHTSQIENFPELEAAPVATWEDDNFIEKLIVENAIDLRHGGNRAFFHHKQDYVVMPEKGQFDSSENYYATLLHEFYHWTGFKDREDRVFGTSRDSAEYALEELRAESFSCLAGMMLDLPVNLGNHAAYLSSWKDQLSNKAGVKAIIQSMNEAGKMLDAVMAFRDGQTPLPEWWGAANTPEPTV